MIAAIDAVFVKLEYSYEMIFVYLVYVLYSVYFGHVISGWASVIFTIVFFGGLNLIVLGIIGVYVGKLFMQSKNRPNYIIRNTNIQR
jgi:dolichol-phosphate mannosyltransferase